MNRAPVSVVLVTWNSGDVLPACLRSLAAAEPPPVELVVVDNASTDGTAELLERFAGGALPTRIVRNDRNTGFAAAANRGIAEAREPFVLLLNPDVRLLAGTIGALHGSLSIAPEDVAVCGGKLLRASGDELLPTDVVDSTGIVMTPNGRHFDRGAGQPDREQWDAMGEVFGITGALALFRKSALLDSRVDGEFFDEDFFAYREDVDLAWRLRGFGFRALFDPDAVAYHRRTVVPEVRRALPAIVNFHSVKNRFLLRIHHADGGWWRIGWPSLFRDLVVLAACLSVEWTSLPAFPWLLRNRKKHLARRREILARRKVSSESLREWFA